MGMEGIKDAYSKRRMPSILSVCVCVLNAWFVVLSFTLVLELWHGILDTLDLTVTKKKSL